MMRAFGALLAHFRYLFVLTVLALVVLAVGSLGRGIFQVVELASTGSFVIQPGGGTAVVPYFIRAAFLYFLAVALGSLFLGDIPAPQWMTVKNLFQLRNKILAFVSIILPLGFMGRMMEADITTPGVLYSGAGVFLVLMGIYFLTRFGSPSGDEGMAREGNRVTEVISRDDRRQEDKGRPSNKVGAGRAGKDRRQSSRRDQDEWLKKQKEELKFQKESLEKAVEKEISGETGERPTSHVTVKPGPRRPRGRRR